MERVTHIPILTSYVFESDVESHVTAGELSDLSDVFDDMDNRPVETALACASATMSLDEIPYDRDLKRINVPVNTRPKGLVNHPGASRMLKCVDAITARSSDEKSAPEKKKAPATMRVAQRRRDPGGGAPPLLADVDKGRQGSTGGKSGRGQGPLPPKTTPRGEAADSARKDKRPPRSAKFGKEGAGRSSAPASEASAATASPLPPPPSPPQMAGRIGQLNPCAQEFVPSFLSR